MRRYFAGLVLLVALVAAAAVLIPSLVPLNYDKNEIIAEVKAVTGRDLTITGPLELTLFPRLAIEAHGVAFANPRGSLHPAMVKLDTIAVELKVLPLLWGRVEIARFVLRKPEIDLEVAASGIPNWVFSLTPASATVPEAATSARSDAASSALARIVIAKMHIDKGLLSFENRRDGTSQTITGLTADVSLPGANGPFAISATGSAQGQRYALNLTGVIAITPTVARIDKAVFKIDSIAGTGALAFDSGGSRPRIAGDLILHRLDLNPYLPKPPAPIRSPTKRGTMPPPRVPQNAGWDNTPIDVSPLSRIDADLFVSADEIRIRKIDLGASALHLVLVDGNMDLGILRLSAYGGHGSGSLTLRSSGPAMALSAVFNLKGIQIQPLLSDGAGYNRLSGNASWSGQWASTGDSQRDLIGNLQGSGAFQAINGSLRGISLLDMLADPILERGEPGGRTTIEHLTATYVIADGIVSNHDLIIKSGNLSARGDGTADLARRNLDYRLTPKKLGISIPIQITGPWDALRFRMPFGRPLDTISKQVAKPILGLKSLFRLP